MIDEEPCEQRVTYSFVLEDVQSIHITAIPISIAMAVVVPKPPPRHEVQIVVVPKPPSR